MNSLDISSAIPYQLVVNVNSIPANGTGDATVTVQSNMWFGVYSVRINTTADTASDVQPNNVSVRLKTNTSQQYFSNDYVPQSAMSPRAVVMPMFNILIPPNTQLTVEVRNNTGSTLSATVVLLGVGYFARP